MVVDVVEVDVVVEEVVDDVDVDVDDDDVDVDEVVVVDVVDVDVVVDRCTNGTVVVVVAGAVVVVVGFAVVDVVAELDVVVSAGAATGVPATASSRRSLNSVAASRVRYTTEAEPAVPTRPGATVLLMRLGSIWRASAASCGSFDNGTLISTRRNITLIHRNRPLSSATSARSFASPESSTVPWCSERLKSP